MAAALPSYLDPDRRYECAVCGLPHRNAAALGRHEPQCMEAARERAKEETDG